MKNAKIDTVQKYFDSLAKGDLDTLGSLLADDVIWHQPGQGKLSKTYKGKNEVFGLFGQFMEISQGSFKIDAVAHLMSNEDLVTATVQFSAKKPNGQSIAMNGVDLMKIESGKIKEVYLFSADQAAEDAFWG
jgi:ketosteroid isomerase-like protein